MQRLQPVPPQAPKLLKSRPTPFAVKKNSPTTGNFLDSQEWLQERFEGLTSKDFSDQNAAIYSAKELAAPLGFQHIWQTIREHHRIGGSVPAEEFHMLTSVQVILVFADINDTSEMQDLKHVAGFFESFFAQMQRPSVFFVQHSVKPRWRQPTDEDSQFRALVDISSIGVHGSIIDEKTSFQLAWVVRKQLHQRSIVQQQCSDCVLAGHEAIEAEQELSWRIDDMFWYYFKARLNVNLPPVDRHIAPGLPLEIDDVQVGAFVGAGFRGQVYSLMQGGVSMGHVVKRIPKHRIMQSGGMQHLRRQIDVMTLVSSKTWAHPHVVKLHNIYHSETHVFFRMGDGGSRDLSKRLRHRDSNHSPLNVLSPQKVKAICSQIASAVCHLHTGPKVVHCDIKLENIIVSETAEDIRITVADLDTAIVKPRIPCYGVVGTYPSMAPEILLHEMFNPYAADVWSMAVVFLEVVCCRRILEKSLSLRSLPGQADRRVAKAHQKKMTAVIHQFFGRQGSTSQLLDDHLRPELQELMPFLMAILPGMLNVITDSRSTSSDVSLAFDMDN